jgi:hypothetical protein
MSTDTIKQQIHTKNTKLGALVKNNVKLHVNM